MALNPKQEFSAITFTRGQIADRLNDRLPKGRLEISPADPRLTDGVCQQLVDDIAFLYKEAAEDVGTNNDVDNLFSDLWEEL